MVTYQPDRKGTARILNSPAMSRVAVAAATAGARYARSISPKRTGEYARSFRVEPTRVKVRGQSRPAALIVNTSPHAQAVEWGEHGHRVLNRTLAELRRRYDPKTKRR